MQPAQLNTFQLYYTWNFRITGISENAFASTTSLRELILDDNLLTTFGISSVSFNGLSKLSILSMNQNSFTEFPPELPGSLSALYLAQNQISFISKRSTALLTNLTVLNLAENKLSDGSIEESTFVNLRQLKELRLGHNFFSSVPKNLPRSLTELSLIANQIMTLKSACLKSFQVPNKNFFRIYFGQICKVVHGHRC